MSMKSNHACFALKSWAYAPKVKRSFACHEYGLDSRALVAWSREFVGGGAQDIQPAFRT
jgi:hypothetical protein